MYLFVSPRWLNPSDPSNDSNEILFDRARNILESEFEFVILEFRDTFGSSVKFFEPEFETKRIDLNVVVRQQQISAPFEVVVVNCNGTIFKQKF
jgi:hypothetical protein